LCYLFLFYVFIQTVVVDLGFLLVFHTGLLILCSCIFDCMALATCSVNSFHFTCWPVRAV